MAKRRGVDEPNYTQVPNVLLDEYILELSGSEFKVAAIIVRHTFGYHRKRQRMSLTFLKNKTGLARDTVNEAVQTLMDKGLVARRKSGNSFAYELIVRKSNQDTSDKQSENPTSNSPKILPEMVGKPDTVKEKNKEKVERKTGDNSDEPPNLSEEQARVAKAYADSRLPFVKLETLQHVTGKYGAPLMLEAIRRVDDQDDDNLRSFKYLMGTVRGMERDGWKPPEQETPRPKLKVFKPAADDEVIDLDERKRLAELAATSKPAVLGATGD